MAGIYVGWVWRQIMLSLAAVPMGVYKIQMKYRTDWARLQYMPTRAETRAGAVLVGFLRFSPSRLWHPLVYMKTEPVASWVGLGCSIHQFM